MELFDKRFVHFMWDDALKGKLCFVADNIEDLTFAVRNDGRRGVKTNALHPSPRASLPFLDSILNNCYPFAYYDPNYEVKRAFYKEGKQIQVAYKGANNWVDCDEPEWVDGCQFRVKPECPCEDGKSKYKPYVTVDEFIQDFQERFPTAFPRPAHSMPLIWVRNKNKKDEMELIYCFRHLVIKMDNTYWDMDELFNQWEYLDGSPIGMVED
jgi:hypothetical protein